MKIDLWEQVNANSFQKVNAFGSELQFWFMRKPGAVYSSRIGRIEYWSDAMVILVVNVSKGEMEDDCNS